MLKLPSFEWFMGQLNFRGAGNMYSGSFGCDPYYGNIGDDIFRYRVWIDTDENSERILKAGYYYGNNSYDETDAGDVTEEIFEASKAGIEAAGEWIMKNYNGGKKDGNQE